MASGVASFGEAAGLAQRLLRHGLAIGHTRLELLLVELQEERERIVAVLLLALAALAVGLLAGIVLTALIAVLLWKYSPVAVLLALFLIYSGVCAFLLYRLSVLRRDWRLIPATLEELAKDRDCINQILQ